MKKLLCCLLSGVLALSGICAAPVKAQAADYEAYYAKLRQMIADSWNSGNYSPVKPGGSGGQDFSTKRLIVQTKLGASIAKAIGASQYLLDEDGYCILQFEQAEQAKAAFEKIKAMAGVTSVEADSIVTACDSFSATSFRAASSGHLSWGADRIKADDFIGRMSDGQRGNAVTVAVIDTGVTSSHEALSGRMVAGTGMHNGGSSEDGNGHGTHVAGIIADSTRGTKVQIMPIQVLDANGQGSNLTIAAGIQWAMQHGANVINLSLGGYDPSSSHYLDSVIQKAIDAGIVVVAAAGNDNASTDRFCPAHVNGVICVSAVDANDKKASFSNYGSNVSLAAPGVNIKSAGRSGYVSMSGTSMAAPYVSAAAALVKATDMGATPASVKQALQNASDDRGSSGWDSYYGSGVLNLANVSTGQENTPPPETSAPETKPETQPDQPDSDKPWKGWQPPAPPEDTPEVPMYAISVSVKTQKVNGKTTAALVIKTKKDGNQLSVKIDDIPFDSALSNKGDGNYEVSLKGIGHGTHRYEIVHGDTKKTGSFIY